MNNKITIYTDGAAKGNPGQAGWGAIIMLNNSELKVESKKLKVVEIGGRSEHATNNQMELMAPIEALKHVKKNLKGEIEIHSDSKYVILGITEWIENWMKNGWRNAAKKPVVNQELWEELYELNKLIKPKWSYVKGHSGHEFNDRVDLIATSFAEGEPVELRK
jgi:ribonuclease HI